jgi:sensor histidine kinase YesM
VSNTYDPDSTRTSRRGVGLINIHSRLKLIYKREDLMRVVKDGDRFEVELILPQEKDS